mmetsp:Transcript_19629/g.29294  ORF Transcript_19629/g.29294 Transcript_19629/m.29294 type:complete len:275 (+) Transcript_19629:250-1074(+)
MQFLHPLIRLFRSTNPVSSDKRKCNTLNFTRAAISTLSLNVSREWGERAASMVRPLYWNLGESLMNIGTPPGPLDRHGVFLLLSVKAATNVQNPWTAPAVVSALSLAFSGPINNEYPSFFPAGGSSNVNSRSTSIVNVYFSFDEPNISSIEERRYCSVLSCIPAIFKDGEDFKSIQHPLELGQRLVFCRNPPMGLGKMPSFLISPRGIRSQFFRGIPFHILFVSSDNLGAIVNIGCRISSFCTPYPLSFVFFACNWEQSHAVFLHSRASGNSFI